jgi:serine phosphatase RsbU (regulator of sigma subunit)
LSSGIVKPVTLVDYAVATFLLPGESDSGDQYIVVPTRSGALLGVVDGLGHGHEAAHAAKVATAILESAADEPLVSLVHRCHSNMKNTRGAVMSLGSFDNRNHTVTWLSVGNVEGKLLRHNAEAKSNVEHILMRSGVVGFKLPALRAMSMAVSPGDLLIFATDGIRSGYAKSLHLDDPLQQIADFICNNYRKGNDDALVLVVRFTERTS